jgi:hypothetical protein
MKQTNENEMMHETVQQLVHGLLDAEAKYAMEINRLAEKWFAFALAKEASAN